MRPGSGRCGWKDYITEPQNQQVCGLRVGEVCGIKSPTRDLEGEGNGTPLQYTCLENPMDRGAWWAAVYGVANDAASIIFSVAPTDGKSKYSLDPTNFSVLASTNP